MSGIRVVWGSATGPTSVGAFDAALAGAGVHDYNLVTVSSVIPAGVPLEVVGTAPSLGSTGDGLTVVLSRRTVGPGADRPAVAGLGWARSDDGPGVFYEAAGDDPEEVRAEIRDGLEHAVDLRDWPVADSDALVRAREPVADAFATAVVLGIYGESRPIL